MSMYMYICGTVVTNFSLVVHVEFIFHAPLGWMAYRGCKSATIHRMITVIVMTSLPPVCMPTALVRHCSWIYNAVSLAFHHVASYIPATMWGANVVISTLFRFLLEVTDCGEAQAQLLQLLNQACDHGSVWITLNANIVPSLYLPSIWFPTH